MTVDSDGAFNGSGVVVTRNSNDNLIFVAQAGAGNGSSVRVARGSDDNLIEVGQFGNGNGSEAIVRRVQPCSYLKHYKLEI